MRRAELRLGAGEVALPPEDQPQVVGVRGIRAGQARGLADLAHRLVEALALGEELAQHQAWPRRGRVELDRLPQLALRIVEIGGLAEAGRPIAIPEVQAQVVAGAGQAGRGLDDVAEERDRAVHVAEPAGHDAEPVAGLHHRRLEAERRLVRGDRLRRPPLPVHLHAELELRFGAPGRRRRARGRRTFPDDLDHRALQVAVGVAALLRVEAADARGHLRRPREVALLAVGLRQVVERNAALRVERHRLLELGDGRLEIAAFEQQPAQLRARGREVAVRANRRSQRFDRLGGLGGQGIGAGAHHRHREDVRHDMVLPPRELAAQDLDCFVRLARLHPDHPQRGIGHGLVGAQAARGFEVPLRLRHLGLHRAQDPALHVEHPGVRQVAQAGLHDLQSEGVVVVLEADRGQVHVVLGRLRLEPRGFAQGVVGLLDAAGTGIGAGDEVVELGGGLRARGDQLAPDADRLRVVSGLDQHQHLVEAGGRGVAVAVPRGAEETRGFRMGARLAEDHAGLEAGVRIVRRAGARVLAPRPRAGPRRAARSRSAASTAGSARRGRPPSRSA